MEPRYPVYIISKGRHDVCLTAQCFERDGVDFKLVVEPQEAELYADAFGANRIIETPFSNLGLGSIPARNFVWEHAKAAGHARHWIFDDNIYKFRRWQRGHRIPCDSKPALCALEDFTDRYENIAVSGFNYTFFCRDRLGPFNTNCHVYSSLLIRNDLPYRWRGRYNEDTDLCLQVLAGGWCTVLWNVFMIDKAQTMKMKGGNTDQLYKGDGRLRMARSLERVWPGVVEVGRRFKRPQHVVAKQWRAFDTPLIRRKDVDWDNLKPNNYGLRLEKVAETVASPRLRRMLDEQDASGNVTTAQ